MTKYETGGFGLKLIVPVTITRESNKSVWFGNDSRLKRSSYRNYFDTWDQAREYLITKAQERVTKYENQMNYAKEKLGEILKVLSTEE